MPAFGLLVADARMPRIVRRGPSRGRVRGRRPAPGDLSPSNARTRPVYSGQAALRSKSSRSAPTRSKPGKDSAPDQPPERCSRPQRDSAQTDPAPADYPTTGRVAEQARNIQPAEIRFDSAWRRQQRRMNRVRDRGPLDRSYEAFLRLPTLKTQCWFYGLN